MNDVTNFNKSTQATNIKVEHIKALIQKYSDKLDPDYNEVITDLKDLLEAKPCTNCDTEQEAWNHYINTNNRLKGLFKR